MLREKDLITPKGPVFLPNIFVASEGIQYLTLLHYNVKEVTVFSPPTPPFPYTHQACPLQAQRIYFSLYKLLHQLKNQNVCQAPQKPKTSAPPQRGLKEGKGKRKQVVLKHVLVGLQEAAEPSLGEAGKRSHSTNHSLHPARAQLHESLGGETGLNFAGETPHRISLQIICN